MVWRRHELLELLGWILGIAMMVWGAGIWLERRHDVPIRPPVVNGAAVEEPDVTIAGVQLLHTPFEPATQSAWELTARSAELFEGRHIMELQEIQATLTSSQQTAAVLLRGERGRLDLQQMNFEVLGEVRPLSMQLADRYQLTTSRLLWDNAAGLLTTDQPITLTGEGLTITGTGLQWSSIDGTAAVLDRVQTVFTP